MPDTATFLPFHAINDFMRPDFRLSVIRDVISNILLLPHENASDINRLTKQLVKIPGFRNSEKAPSSMKILPMGKSFEKNPELVSAILTAWANIHHELFLQMYDILKQRNWFFIDNKNGFSFNLISTDMVKQWPVLPPDVDRSRAPGFFPLWPKGEDFEVLYNTYQSQFPGNNYSIDQVSLMAVWLTLRLPYTFEETQTAQLQENS